MSGLTDPLLKGGVHLPGAVPAAHHHLQQIPDVSSSMNPSPGHQTTTTPTTATTNYSNNHHHPSVLNHEDTKLIIRWIIIIN